MTDDEFAESLQRIYADLLTRQLDPEMERVLMENLSDLYED